MRSTLLYKIVNMKKLLFALLASAALVGCSDDNETTYPITLTYDGIEPRSEMSVFTEGGKKLTSETTISNFLAHEYIIYTPGGVTWYNSAFVEPDETNAKTSDFIFQEDRTLYSVDIKDIFKEGDATIMRSVIDNKADSTSVVKSGLLKYSPKLDEYDNYYYQYVIHGDYHKALDLSLLYYKLVRYDENGKIKNLIFGTVHNEFDESFLSTLTARDTLAVKQYALKYSRK